jgi:hypothetical protein
MHAECIQAVLFEVKPLSPFGQTCVLIVHSILHAGRTPAHSLHRGPSRLPMLARTQLKLLLESYAEFLGAALVFAWHVCKPRQQHNNDLNNICLGEQLGVGGI